MISKRIHWQLIFRVFMLCLVIICATYLCLEAKYIWASIMGIVMIIQVYNLIYFLNSTNRKIAYFIKALINEDFTLKFNSTKNDTSLNELNVSLNQLNKKIQSVYMQNQTQEKYYQELLKQAEIGVLTINNKGHILFANPKAEKLLNYSPLNHVKQFNRVSSELYQILSKSNTFEKKLLSLSNEREVKQLALKSTEIVLNKECIRLITLQDIRTELDHKETDSWMKLIRVLTHEIMNSITPITSISESLLTLTQEAKEVTPTQKGLQVIKNQSDDLIRFVQSYRSFLNIPKPDRKIINIRELFDRIQLVFREEIQVKNIRFQVNIEDGLETIYVDEQQFSQVLINILKNAFQAIELKSVGKISLNVQKENKETIVSITNNGVSIPKEELAHIFVPFFTTKEKGTGIGLSLSKQIIQLHGGSLEVVSVIDQTSFVIRI